MKIHVVFSFFLLFALVKAAVVPSISVRKFTAQDKFTRIVGGLPAELGQFPYVVHLKARSFCGGSLISPNWVLTAGSCIFGSQAGAVYIGSIAINFRYLYIVTDDFRTHPQYNPINRNHDIGIINLHHTVHYSDRIRPIALPRKSQTFENFASGMLATVTGWGQTNEGEGTSNELLYGNVVVNTNTACEAIIGSEYIINSTLCASPPSSSQLTLCFGDIGNPLTVFDFMDGIDIQIGVANYYGETCVSGTPASYVRPQFYWDWISANTGIEIRP